ncbi:activating signal cointegrator 1 complex subunit 1 [Trichinella spiralis]|uniref:activating signal cointegrator 1 complex subunit 1 n=1 Tax=Trichinella spiralis TaxID=6334 RepID=UPI0001EFBA40|nr:activating signal cointegrator 1 complex subunit 1 [Trichinella spiralis]
MKYVKCNNICKDLFQNPNRLHLTVGTLVLMNENERKIARELLHQCKESVVLCRLHGIEIMNDDPANVNVLYGKVEFDSVEELDSSLLTKYVSTLKLLVCSLTNLNTLNCMLLF